MSKALQVKGEKHTVINRLLIVLIVNHTANRIKYKLIYPF
jgi:DNA-directed RNA polymerase subunit L